MTALLTAANDGPEPIAVTVPGPDGEPMELIVPPGSLLHYDPNADNGPDLTDALAQAGAALLNIEGA